MGNPRLHRYRYYQPDRHLMICEYHKSGAGTKDGRTESEVDDDIVCIKLRADVATGIGEVRRRRTPAVSVDAESRKRDIGRNRVISSRPEPHTDKRISMFDCIPSTSVGVKRWTITVVGVKCHRTTSVEVVGRNTVSRYDSS